MYDLLLTQNSTFIIGQVAWVLGKLMNGIFFVLFTFLMTGAISSQNFFFQKVIENGISKRDVIAHSVFESYFLARCAVNLRTLRTAGNTPGIFLYRLTVVHQQLHLLYLI